MKIQGPKQTSGSAGAKKSSKSQSAGGGFDEYIKAGAAQETSTASAPQSITAVDALLAVQSVEDPTEKAARKRMTLRAGSVLDELDSLYMAVLRGGVSMDHMMRIADKVSAHKERVNDSKLTALLEEIDLRAQVELAKMRKTLDNKI